MNTDYISCSIILISLLVGLGAVLMHIIKQTDENHIDYDKQTKYELIQLLRKYSRKKLNNLSYRYSQALSEFQATNTKLIPLCLELYETLRQNETYKTDIKTLQSRIGKSMNQKMLFNIRPTGDFMQKFNASMQNIKKLPDKNIDCGEIPVPKKEMKNDVVSMHEFEVGFKENDVDKVDILGINTRLLQNANQMTKQIIVNEYNTYYKTSSGVDNTSFGKLYFAYKVGKHGKRDELSSFRQIMSIPKIISVFHRILGERLVNYLGENNYIDTTVQKGIMPGSKYGIPEHIYKVKGVFRNARKNKKPAYVLFIDITNAFGSIVLEQIYKVMEKYDIPAEFTNYIREFYRHYEYFTVLDSPTELRKWTDGLIQGSPLSPILFVLVVNHVLSYLNKKYVNTHGYVYNSKCRSLFTAYIDDICIMCDTYEHLCEVYKELRGIFTEIGLEINFDKSGFMSVGDDNNRDELETIKKVNEYRYLGEYVTDNASPEIPFQKYMKELAGKLYHLDNKKIDLADKSQIFMKFIWIWIQYKGVAMYDLSDEKKDTVIQYIKRFTDKWNVPVDINIYSVFKNIKVLLNDSTDQVINDIIDDYDAEHIEDQNNALYTRRLFEKNTDLQNFTYNTINDGEMLDDVLNNIKDNNEVVDRAVQEIEKAQITTNYEVYAEEKTEENKPVIDLSLVPGSPTKTQNDMNNVHGTLDKIKVE